MNKQPLTASVATPLRESHSSHLEADTLNDTVPLWTASEAAAYLRVCIKTVYNLRKKGLPYLPIGGAVRFVPSEVKTYLLQNRGLAMHRRRQIVRKGGKL